jgi:uncharacterized membrane protein
MSSGWLAATIVLAAIGFWIATIVAFFACGFGVYKTGRYAYKDMQPWMERLREFGDAVTARVESLQAKGEELSEIAARTEKSWNKTLGIAEEIRSHPLVRLAERRSGR